MGIISIIVLIVFVGIIGQFNIPNIVKRKIFHLPPLILFPILNELTRDLFLVALAGIFYILFAFHKKFVVCFLIISFLIITLNFLHIAVILFESDTITINSRWLKYLKIGILVVNKLTI